MCLLWHHPHRTAQPHPGLHGAWVAFCHAMIGEGLHDAGYAETIDGHAKVSNGWLSAGTALGQADVVGARTNAETSRNALAMLDRQPEQALVELYRLLAVGNLSVM